MQTSFVGVNIARSVDVKTIIRQMLRRPAAAPAAEKSGGIELVKS